MNVLESQGTRRRPRTRRSPRLRQRTQETDEPIVLDDSIVAVDEPSCIDLTSSVDDDDFVDLTSGQPSQQSSEDNLGANDNSVVVIGTPNASPPPHRRNIQERFPVLDDSDDDLPEIPIKISKPNSPTSNPSAGSSSTELLSPEPTKISCPVCFDDDKTIKRNKNKLASTSCGHVFCKPCLDSAVRLQRCCPVCRKKLTTKNIFVLHL